MPISVGTRLGPYEILAPIGAGGMGEVYRARDLKLKRDIALKVLPEALADDPARMLRFEREAEVLASLNHPNIAHIYGVEGHALAMELVEGESPKGPLAFDEAWKIAMEIADALEYAHNCGIIHRDLKPANVKVTPDGVVKLLDFGLAKAFSESPESVAGNPVNSPTITLGATAAGTIMGTAAYMAPEQAKGKRVDKRGDIWSWGVMLYELLTGDRLFKGDDAADTLAQVLTKEPDLTRVPLRVRNLLRRCLEKDPKQRLRDIGDAPDLLENDRAAPPEKSRLYVGLAIGAALILAAITLVLFRFGESPPRTVLRYTIPGPDQANSLQYFAISPDGRMVAMVANTKGRRQLWLRRLDTLEAHPMPDTDEAIFPFWSPDNRYVGFFAQGKLKKVAANGGPAQSVCDAAGNVSGAWSGDDFIVFTDAAAIKRVAASGGVPSEVIGPPHGARYPSVLPDGRHFLYLGYGGSAESNGIYFASQDGKENRRILADVSNVLFSAGRLLFVRENTLMAQPFDADRGRLTGEATPVAEGVSADPNGILNFAPISASEAGVLLYTTTDSRASNRIAWYDRTGKLLETLGSPGPVFDPAISADERSIAFRRSSGLPGTNLWLRGLARGTEERLVTQLSSNMAPFWSPQGDRVVFASNRSGNFDLYLKATSGTGQDELLMSNQNYKFPTQWSRDGRFVLYREIDPKTKFDVWVLPMAGSDRKAFPFLHSEFNEFFGQLSPDSRWMAYTSDESGQREIYVRPFPSSERQWKISISGGEQPRWRGDGKELYFWAADGNIMAVPVKSGAGNSFEPGTPQPLFEAHLPPTPLNALYEYDVSSDGKRFLLATVEAAAPQIIVVVNWDAGLKK